MNNIIIHEENNNLIIKDDYSPLVCGNTNYTLEFVFGEDWQKTTNKIAVFFVGDQKTAVPFTGSLLSVPALPNAQIMQLVLMTAETENTRLVSSVLDINLKPTILLETIPELKPLSRYAEEMLTKIDALENGTLEVSNSKHSQVAEFASNVSNPNLLINGDFKVNQRGNTTYTEAGKYTVDRWKLLSGTVDVAENGIVLNGTIIQKLEHSPSAPVVASSNAGNIFYENGAVTISTTTPTLINFAKLEVGTTATPFSPRPYAEELALCQRYYFKATTNKSYGTFGIGFIFNASENTSKTNIIVTTPQHMRTPPTFSYNGTFQLYSTSYASINSISNQGYTGNTILLEVITGAIFTKGNSASLRATAVTDYVDFDAEIY